MDLAVVDLVDGTLVEGYEAKRSSEKRLPLPSFVMMCRAVMLAAVTDSELTGESLRVLFFILGKTQIGNRCSVASQAEIGAALGIARQSVTRGMGMLFEKGLLVRGVRIGRGHSYQINPRLGYHGTGSEWLRALSSAPPLALPTGKP
jgi:biotin operon repressor